MNYLIGALVVANLLCFAWFNGWMAPLGGDGREPDRTSRQIEPQRLRIAPPYRMPADAPPTSSQPSGESPGEPSSTSSSTSTLPSSLPSKPPSTSSTSSTSEPASEPAQRSAR